MAEIAGKLIVDLLLDGTVQMVFVPDMGGGNSSPLIAKNLDVAEGDFVTTFGLTPTKAAVLRTELALSRSAIVSISVDVELAATLCVPRVAGA